LPNQQIDLSLKNVQVICITVGQGVKNEEMDILGNYYCSDTINPIC
jgi:hypothetical protein